MPKLNESGVITGPPCGYSLCTQYLVQFEQQGNELVKYECESSAGKCSSSVSVERYKQIPNALIREWSRVTRYAPTKYWYDPNLRKKWE